MYPFDSIVIAGILKGAGHRAYQNGTPTTPGTNAYGLYLFGSTSNYQIQGGLNPTYENADAHAMEQYYAGTIPNLLLSRFAKTGYLYDTVVGAPDVAYNILPGLRQHSGTGNLLMALNTLSMPQTRTVDLSNCEITGQSIIRYIASDWQHLTLSILSAGTMSDTPTFPAGGWISYLCSNNEAAEIHQPTLAPTLLSGASSIVIQWAYSPYFLRGQARSRRFRTLRLARADARCRWIWRLGRCTRERFN